MVIESRTADHSKKLLAALCALPQSVALPSGSLTENEGIDIEHICGFMIGKEEEIGMNIIELIITVCAVASPTTCEERHLSFSAEFSLQQCAMNAPPYIAQWIGQHPKWTAVKWRCEYPHTREKI